jgi:hypothetical protein
MAGKCPADAHSWINVASAPSRPMTNSRLDI